MSWWVFGALALAGGVGASTRLIFDGLVRSWLGSAAPWGTMAINISGSFVLGLVTGLAAAHALPPEVEQIVGAGFLGGYTTFSTASYEAVRLLQERRWGAGIVVAGGVLIAAAAAAGLGLWLGGR